MKFNQRQLDSLGTVLGTIAGISIVLTTQGIIDAKLGQTVSGIATVLLGVVVQRPENKPPTPEEVEQEEAKPNLSSN